MPSYYNIRINFARNSVRHLADQDMKRVIHNGGILDYKLDGRKADFFTFRHTGASHLAEKTKNPVLIIKMMGDTNITTVMRHYFNLDFEFMQEMVSGGMCRRSTDAAARKRSE